MAEKKKILTGSVKLIAAVLAIVLVVGGVVGGTVAWLIATPDPVTITLKLSTGALATIDGSRKAVYGYDQRG